MAIDLQKLEQKFNALFEDENTVAEFEQWLEARNVKPALQQTLCTTLLPSDEELDELDQRIINADPHGWDTVIKDLKLKINNITAKVREAKKAIA